MSTGAPSASTRTRPKVDDFDTDGNWMLRGLCRLWLADHCDDDELLEHIRIVGHSREQASLIVASWRETRDGGSDNA